MDQRFAKRIQRDIATIVSNPPEGIFAEPDNDNISFMKVLIMGPKGTPYEGGMFLFQVEFGNDYPGKPPKVKLLTTDCNKFRFNPNLYACGKVCLSLLGTWSGPGWSPVISLSTLMVAIQSLMNETPYHNEPGHEGSTGKEVDLHRDTIQHGTIRIAAIDAYEKKNSYPETFIGVIDKAFKLNFDFYVEVCKKNIERDGKPFSTFGGNNGNFCYKKLLEKLESLKSEV